MYCSQCGAELPETAQFCSQCGASTVAAPAASDGNAPHAEDVLPLAPADRQADDAVACAGGPSVPGEAHVDEPSAADSVSEGKQTLGRRLLMFRRTTLKAVPTFVLALFAFMATVATAYAAFKVVTEVIIPAIEQVVEQGQDGSDGTGTAQEGAESSGEGAVSAANEEAHAAYDQVLDDYRKLMAENAGVIASAGEFGTMIGDMSEYSEERQAWVGDIVFSKDSRLYYAYLDIDGDLVDELFVSVGDESSSSESGFVFCGFDYADGAIIRFAESITRGSYYLSKDGLLVGSGSGGFDTGIVTASKWDGSELVVQEAVSWNPADDADRGNPDSPYVLSTTKDGKTREETVLWSAVEPARDAFIEKHSSADPLDWIMLE